MQKTTPRMGSGYAQSGYETGHASLIINVIYEVVGKFYHTDGNALPHSWDYC